VNWLVGFTVPAFLCVLPGGFALATAIGQDIQVTEAWIRWLPANVPSGGYMTLTNTGTVPRVLIGAASADFGAISFHQTRSNNGVSQMAAVGALTVAPRRSLRFTPGGYHLMLMQPKRALHPGDHVSISLRFAGGQSLEVLFEVRTAGAEPPAPANDMGDMPGMQH
jgi:copper(I)-binding protein